MTIKIECEVSDLLCFTDRLERLSAAHVTADRRANALQDEVYRLNDLAMLHKPATPPLPSFQMATELSYLIKAVQSGSKIAAIKAVRTMGGFGLKEAKDLVEACFPDGSPMGRYQG